MNSYALRGSLDTKTNQKSQDRDFRRSITILRTKKIK